MIAPNEPDVICICGKYKWQSYALVLDDGSVVWTGCHVIGNAGKWECIVMHVLALVARA